MCRPTSPTRPLAPLDRTSRRRTRRADDRAPRSLRPLITYDAVVVGGGPNGLTAAIVLARAGRSVLVLEAEPTVGGAVRSAALTIPGVMHDICSSVHPLAAASPFLRTLPLAEHGLEWVHSPSFIAHPFDDGTAAVLERSVARTLLALGADRSAYADLLGPLSEHWLALLADVLGPLRLPRHPIWMARFARHAVRSADSMARATFREERTRALFAGIAAHSALPLETRPTAAFALTLAIAGHAVGWPIARGGSQRLADALASYLRTLGGEMVTGVRVDSLDALPPASIVMLDLTPRQILRIAGSRLPSRYRDALEAYRYGVGTFKMDWVLAGPIPWRASECARAATVHLGGTLDEITSAERAPTNGEHVERPFVLLGSPTPFDSTRAPPGLHTAWAYCHVPHASAVDMTERIERQIERFAPGFRDLVLARSALAPAALERHDANLVGGDISGGSMDLAQLFFRPARRRIPYATPLPGVFICSASTPPGGAVHGMCGYYAALAALGLPMRAPDGERVADGDQHQT